MASISFGNENRGMQLGVNNGSIHLPPERLETPPAPLSTVPFRRDPDFVSRDTLLDEIHRKISAPSSRVALVGIGGVGKSQLSIEYSYRVRSQTPSTWVLWIHASNAARFEQSFRDIAEQAKLFGRKDPIVNIFQLVESWLQDAKRKWLLILDNVDDDGFLRQPATGQQGLEASQSNLSTKPLLEYLPRSSNGSILITSRNREVALKMIDHQDVIQVHPMARPEALELLQRKAGLAAVTPDSSKLVEELDFMPLAIIQAASYITHRAPRCSVSQYLELLQKSDREVIKLLDYEAGHHYRDWEAKNSILVTWQISFNYIRRTRPSAADLLSLMSFFDRHGVSQDLLRVQQETNTENSSSEENTLEYSDDTNTDSPSKSNIDQDFEVDISTLRDFSFISVNKDSTVFTMHRLVQLTVRVWLKTAQRLERWKEQFIMILWQRFPTGEFENWARCQSLFPHVKSAISQRPGSQDTLEKWATLLYNGAWYAQASGNIAESIEMASISRTERVFMFGLESEKTLESSEMLAGAYEKGGRWDEAEQLEVQVIETRKTRLGADHPDTLTSMGNLALALWNQGRWKEAEQLEVQVIETRKTRLGADHPNTLTSMANLALALWKQGRWEEAEQLQVQALETLKTKLGVDHFDTLAVMGNLASTLWNQGRWKEAEQLELQVMETRKIKLGADHPDTLVCMSKLALVYSKQGRWKEAEQLELQVIETSKIKLGADHPNTLTSMGNLASTLWNQGRWKEAEQLEVQVMETRKTKYGADHPDTLTSMGNLASTYRNQGRWEEAEKIELQVMETFKTKLGTKHPQTLASMGNLALTYMDQCRWEEAEQLEVQALEALKTKLGADHPDTLTVMSNLALTILNQGRLKEAEQLGMQVIEARKTKLGADHPDTLTSMGNLATTYFNQSRFEEAEQSFVHVIETSKTKLGDDHPFTLTSMVNLAYTFRLSGQRKAALLLLAECVPLCDRKVGPDHPRTICYKSLLNEWCREDGSPFFESLKTPTETKDDQRGWRNIFSRLFSRE
ncbi:hypothetical protein N7513_009209 [Penicillium frequentans]|nr:hypothetical protein N7513_009209 [Penicillium glabrum]